jgi:hypothetical protein
LGVGIVPIGIDIGIDGILPTKGIRLLLRCGIVFNTSCGRELMYGPGGGGNTPSFSTGDWALTGPARKLLTESNRKIKAVLRNIVFIHS